jgi:RimJ/RimL family protein N-acetyltransferase
MKYKLRTIENNDLEAIRKMRNAQTKILRQVKPISYNEQQEYFSKIHKDNSQILFAIEDEVEEMIGYCGLVNINYVYSTAEISFITIKSECNVEYSKIFLFILNSLSDFAFNSLGLNKIWTETYGFRTNHISILEQFGMIKEGVLREHVFKDGERHNSIIHSKLKNEHLQK